LPALPLGGNDERWDVPLRLFAAVHYLVLSGDAPDALSGHFEDFAAALVEHEDALRARVETHGVQTNEVQRCTMLLPTFLAATAATGLPLELIELGPSAGLNLLVDRYRYRYANGSFGPADALLELTVEERGERVPAAVLERELVIRRRRGIDLAPVDATTADGYLLLRSFIWPGLDERVARLDAAIETFLTTPNRPTLIQGDYVDLLPDLLADRAEDRLTVVYQTASTGYLTPGRYAELKRSLEHAAADGRPLALVSSRRHDETETGTEDGFELAIRVWPEAERFTALVDFHGNWVDWLAR
jgi:hypothetical protein